MKKMTPRNFLTFTISGAAVLVLATGCGTTHKAEAPTQSGFLQTYRHLEKVDDSTYRYVNAERLPRYKRFHVFPVKVLATQFKDHPLTPEQTQKISEFVGKAIANALSDRYPIVTDPGADVGEIHVAITKAYKLGNQVGYSMEGEILDSYSNVQVAAVRRSEIGEARLGDWWEGPTFKGMIEAWAKRVRQALDQVNAK
jgi:hypothetical protein